MSSLQGLLERIVPALHSAGVPFMVAGSFASAAHGLPRSTNDLDIIIDPTREALDSLLAQLPSDTYYVDVDVAHDALQRRGMFNVDENAIDGHLGPIKVRCTGKAAIGRRPHHAAGNRLPRFAG